MRHLRRPVGARRSTLLAIRRVLEGPDVIFVDRQRQAAPPKLREGIATTLRAAPIEVGLNATPGARRLCR